MTRIYPIIFALSLTACGGRNLAINQRSTAIEAPKTAAATPVEVFEVKSRVAGRAIPAVISVEGTAAVLSKRDGIIVELGGQEGSRVKEGDVLARLSEDESLAQLKQAELEVARLQYEEKQYEASIRVNKSELDRQSTLAREGITSQLDTERAQFKVEVSVQELEKTRLATRMAQARVEAAKLEVAKTVIRSPITGIITQRIARLGTSVIRNDKLFELAKLSPLEVRFQLEQSNLWRPRPGDTVQLALAGEVRVAATARIVRLAPVADSASNARAYQARLSGAPPLIPGTAVSILNPHVNGSTKYWVPREAFPVGDDLRRGTSVVVMVVDGGKSVARKVWLGEVASDMVEVSSGLAPGDRVILSPPDDLKSRDVVAVNAELQARP